MTKEKIIEIVPLDKSYNSGNMLVRYYFHTILDNSVKLANPQPSETVLDFGCGYKILKEKLGKEIIYHGYDINPELNEVKDIKEINPNLIFSMNVLEHLTRDGLFEFIDYVKQKKPRLLITALPTGNIVSKIGGWINKTDTDKFTHINDYKSIKNTLKEHFKHVTQKNIFTMNVIDLWKID